jgi:hypothetical protein
MPTYETLQVFLRDFKRLTEDEKKLFLQAVGHFVHDLRSGQFRKGLIVKKMQGHDDVWEMTWAPDGRATFEYGPEKVAGERHVVWRRIGGHEIFDRP